MGQIGVQGVCPQRAPAKWAHFEGQLDKYGHRPDWWYCNNNQYGAYRFQLGFTKLLELKHDGPTVTLTIERPVLIDVNDDQPLTFEVSGVLDDEVIEAKCATAQCKPADRKTDKYMFNLAHDRDQALPKKIGLVPPNYKNRAAIGENDYDTDFPDLKGLLHFEGGQLKLDPGESRQGGPDEPAGDLSPAAGVEGRRPAAEAR